MSVQTKTRPTKVSRKKTPSNKESRIPWRESCKASIEKHTETGLAVKGARYKAELTQKQLAEKIGVLPHHICEMEYGKRSISKKMARKLAEALDVNYKVFL